MTECPNCGQRLRSGWIRCPRCRELLPEQPAEVTTPAAPAAAAARPQWLWGVVGIAIAAFVLTAIGLLTSGSDGTQTAAGGSSTIGTPVTQAPPKMPEPRPIDSVALAKNLGADARRAGNAAYAMGDFAAALARFQAAVDANPEDPEARNNLAQVLVRQNRAADALPHLDEAVRINPQTWAYRFNRARALAALERWKEAATEYRAAADLFPEDYATQYNLGLTLMRLKQYADSVTALERAVALAPGEPSFLITLGTAYVGAERPDRAKAVLQQFLELAPDDPEAPRVKALIGALTAAAAPQ